MTPSHIMSAHKSTHKTLQKVQLKKKHAKIFMVIMTQLQAFCSAYEMREMRDALLIIKQNLIFAILDGKLF